MKLRLSTKLWLNVLGILFALLWIFFWKIALGLTITLFIGINFFSFWVYKEFFMDADDDEYFIDQVLDDDDDIQLIIVIALCIAYFSIPGWFSFITKKIDEFEQSTSK